MNWEKVDTNWEVLLELIKRFHPNYVEPITKEKAIAKIDLEKRINPRLEERRKIIVPALTVTKDPVEAAEKAKTERHASKMYEILHETWMGAPETRDVYKVPGFSLLCELLET